MSGDSDEENTCFFGCTEEQDEFDYLLQRFTEIAVQAWPRGVSPGNEIQGRLLDEIDTAMYQTLESYFLRRSLRQTQVDELRSDVEALETGLPELSGKAERYFKSLIEIGRGVLRLLEKKP